MNNPSNEGGPMGIAGKSYKTQRASSRDWRGIGVQAFALVLVGAILTVLIYNLRTNITLLGVNTGFDFLMRPAGFAISQSFIPYGPSSSYLAAFTVALLNTVTLVLVCIVIATILGVAIALMRVSLNPLLSKSAAGFVEGVRNVPLLLHLLVWYFVVVRALPSPNDSYSFFGKGFLSNRGLYLPAPEMDTRFLVAVLAGIAAGILIALAARNQKIQIGRAPNWVWLSPLAIIAAPVLAMVLEFGDLQWSIPELRGFNYVGGAKVVPEFVAMALGLSFYSAAFIAEIFRAGINSVAKGQREAGLSLGLTSWLVNLKIVLPLALRAVVPPLGGQYVLMLKNSSLAAAIAYPDLMQVLAGTALNQTGQPLEVMFIALGAYVVLGLLIATVTNVWNHRLTLPTR